MQTRGADSCVLLVEDDFLLGHLIAERLAEEGLAVVGPVSSVQQSFEMLEDRPVSAAILDIKLRDGTCYPLADRLEAKHIPFLFYTGERAQNIPDIYRDHQVVSKTAPPYTLVAVLDEIM